MGTTIGLIKGDTRSLDYSSHGPLARDLRRRRYLLQEGLEPHLRDHQLSKPVGDLCTLLGLYNGYLGVIQYRGDIVVI